MNTTFEVGKTYTDTANGKKYIIDRRTSSNVFFHEIGSTEILRRKPMNYGFEILKTVGWLGSITSKDEVA